MVNQVDALLSQIGNGKWNIFHFTTVSLASGLLAPFAMAGAFVVPRLRHTCRQPFNTNSTQGIHTNLTTQTSSCSYLARTPDGELKEEPCTAWDYDHSTFSRTITSEFDLVCQKEYIRALYMSLYMLGVLVASPSLGYISDRFGRKRTFVTGMLVLVCLSHISGWLPNIPSLLVCRFLIGMTHVPVVKIAFIIGMETCSPQLRSIVGIFLYLPWSILTIAFAGLAYLERDWRWLLTFSSFATLVFVPTLWFIDESPHWLAVRGEYGSALKVLKKAARWNKAIIPPDEEIIYLLKEHSAVSKTKGTEENQSRVSILKENVKNIFILFRTPRLRIISLVMHLSFFAIGMVYYGLSFSGGSFNIDIFSYMALCGLTEIPGTTIMSPIVARFGRKKPYILGLLITGILLLCLTFVPSDYEWLAVTLALLGRTSICVASAVIYLYASELFPTEVRTRGITYSFMMSRVGSAIAPFITEYLAYSYKWAPSVVFGGASVIAGLASMALWETLGTTLPDTIAFLENNDDPISNTKGRNFGEKQRKKKISDSDVQEETTIPEEKIQLKEDS